MGNRFLQTQSQTSISVRKPEIPEQTVDLLAWLPFTSCPLKKWALEGGEGGGGRQGNIYLFICLFMHKITELERDDLLTWCKSIFIPGL